MKSYDVTGKSLNQIVNMLCANKMTKLFISLAIAAAILLSGIFLPFLLLIGLCVAVFTWIAWPGAIRKSIKRLIQTNSLYCVNDILNGYTVPDPLTNLAFTNTYLYYKNKEKTAIIRYEDVVWVYKKITKHSTNHITTGTTEDVMIHTIDGNAFEILVKSQNRFGNKNPMYNSESDALLITQIYGYNPNIILGYSIENMNEYNRRRRGI